MLSENDRERLYHILDALDKMAVTMASQTYADFLNDWQRQLIVERLLEIMGEAANHLSVGLQSQHTYIPWPKIIGMRNVVSHEYFRIDLETLWKTATEAVPLLRSDIEQVLKQ